MQCEEKENLRDRCIAASDEFEAVAQAVKGATGVLFDFRARNISWAMPQQKFAEARQRHLNASWALSLHLSKHRC
jgi:hypothetical protein